LFQQQQQQVDQLRTQRCCHKSIPLALCLLEEEGTRKELFL
jgi:hypothetical protein